MISSARVARRIALVLITSSAFASVTVRADYYAHFWEDHEQPGGTFLLGLKFNDYTTGSNYDPTGNVTTPTGFSSVNRIESDLNAAFAISNRVSLFGRLTWTIENVNTTSGGATLNGTAYGFTEQLVGANWRVWEAARTTHDPLATSLDLQLQGELPAYSNATADASNLPHLGEGSIDTSVGAFLSLPIKQTAERAVLLTAGAGYLMRTNSYSSAIPWSVTASYQPVFAAVPGVILTGALLGQYSLKTDTNTPPTTDLTTTGGSVISGAVNPSLLTMRGTLGYQFAGGVAITGSYSQSFWGQDAPDGNAFVVGLQKTFGSAGTVSYPGKKPELSKANSGFLNYSLDAKVLRANDRLNLIRIDKGTQDGVEVGNIFDVFAVRSDGSLGEAVARGTVTSVKFNEAALSITDYYKEVWIEEGFTAKKLVWPK